jgi:carbamoyltransferase
VLGISGSWHDSAAVLIRGGRVLAALEEERMTRAKHDNSQFPVNAILRLLSDAGLRWQDVDHVALGWDYNQFVETPLASAPAARLFERLHADYARVRRLRNCDVQRRDVLERNHARFQPARVQSFLESLGRELGSAHMPSVSFVRHHWAHAASAWFASGFEEPTLVVTIDGYGDTETTTVWLGKDGELRLLDSILLPHSLGWVYSSITEYLGFQPLNSEGEVMGLAPYGRPRTPEEVELGTALLTFMAEFVQLTPRGLFRVNPEYTYFGVFPNGRKRVSQTLINRLEKLVPPAVASGRKLDPELFAHRKYAILAWALQQRIEEVVVHLVRHFLTKDRRSSGVRAIALAGGVALNIDANSRLITEGLVAPEQLFVQPAAGDSGVALGAAMVVAREVYKANPKFRMRRADLGPEYSDSEIQAVLEMYGLVSGQDYEVLDNNEAIATRVAGLLAANRVVAWFQGRSEFGPRALGHRSILLNPTDPCANGIANTVKRRDDWRPSAMSIATEYAGRFLEGLPAGAEAPFMNVAFGIKGEKSASLISGRHPADGSSRPQTVTRDQNPLFWELLNHVGGLTGVPAVVNTSFNRDEPLVESPEEALNTFAYMKEVYALMMGRYLITAREKIVPTVPSLREDPRTLPLLAAMRSGCVDVLDMMFAAIKQWSPSTRQISVVLRDRWGCERQQRWPLVKEFFAGEIGAAIRRYLCTAIYNDAVTQGAAEIFVGAEGKYDRVVFDALRAHLHDFNRLAEFANFGDPVRIGRLGGALEPLAQSPPGFEVFRPLRRSYLGWSIGVDVGASATKLVVLQDGQIWRTFTKETPHLSGQALHEHIIDMVERALTQVSADGFSDVALTAIGLAFPGVVTMPRGCCGEIRWLPNLEPRWSSSSPDGQRSNYFAVNLIAASLTDTYSAPVRVLNDAKAFGVAEATQRFYDKSASTVIAVVVLGTGVGDVTIEDGAIYFGKSHQTSQAVIDTNTGSYVDASSGAPGSLSGYLSQARWESEARAVAVPNIDAALAAGDTPLYEKAVGVVAQQAQHLARWITIRYRREGLAFVVLSGGRVAGRTGAHLVAETRRILLDSEIPVEITLSSVDLVYGGAYGAALFALNFPIGADTAIAA